MATRKNTAATTAPHTFDAKDLAVFAACELTAVPLCEAGWDAVVGGDHFSRGIAAIVAGLVVGLLGASFHWLKRKISAPTYEWMRGQASRWWPLFAVLAIIYFAGPTLYKRIIGQNAQYGNILWNFEQTAQGFGYFLTLQRVSGQSEIRFINFGAYGKNISKSPISQFSGYLQSDLTNARLPIYLLAQNPDESTALACFPYPWVPTRPEETYSVPPLAEFQITTFDKVFIEAGKDGIPISNFWKNFGPFTLVLEYDGQKFQRHFSREEIQRQIELFEKSLNPKSNPFVLRRPNASPAVLAPLEPLVVPHTPQPLPTISRTPAVPPRATPIPPGAFKIRALVEPALAE